MAIRKKRYPVGDPMAIELPPGFSLGIVLDDWVQGQVRDDWVIPVSPQVARTTPDLSRYVAGLPDASGEFTGFYDTAVPDLSRYVVAPPSDLIPVEIDTHARPNLLATATSGAVITFGIAGREFRMTVHRVERLGGNKVRALVWRESVTEVTQEDSNG